VNRANNTIRIQGVEHGWRVDRRARIVIGFDTNAAQGPVSQPFAHSRCVGFVDPRQQRRGGRVANCGARASPTKQVDCTRILRGDIVDVVRDQ
jgi:hypothetical protein